MVATTQSQSVKSRALLDIATNGQSPYALGWKRLSYRRATRYKELKAGSESFVYRDDDAESFVGLLANTSLPIDEIFFIDARDITIANDNGAGAYNLVCVLYCTSGALFIKALFGDYGCDQYYPQSYASMTCTVSYTQDGIIEVLPTEKNWQAGNGLCYCLNIVAWCLDTLSYNIQLKTLATPQYKRIDYHAYLQSDKWGTKRQLALERAYHRCQLCNSPDNLHVHHRTYERLGNEKPEDLTVLCKDCHEMFHKSREVNRV